MLVKRSYEFSGMSFDEEILQEFYGAALEVRNNEDLDQGLAGVLVRRSCGDLGEVLSIYLVQVLNRNSCGDPGGILSKRSSHGDLADAMWEFVKTPRLFVSSSMIPHEPFLAFTRKTIRGKKR